MSRHGDRETQTWHNIRHLGRPSDLWLDPRTGEQQINNDISLAQRRSRPHGSQSARLILLNRRQQPNAVRQHQSHQTLAVPLVRDRPTAS